MCANVATVLLMCILRVKRYTNTNRLRPRKINGKIYGLWCTAACSISNLNRWFRPIADFVNAETAEQLNSWTVANAYYNFRIVAHIWTEREMLIGGSLWWGSDSSKSVRLCVWVCVFAAWGASNCTLCAIGNSKLVSWQILHSCILLSSLTVLHRTCNSYQIDKHSKINDIQEKSCQTK